MKPNIGSTDKAIRIILGLFVLSFLVWGPRTLWGLLGLLPLATALVNFCPVYKALGISSRAKPRVESGHVRK